jgi:hypothetical protein
VANLRATRWPEDALTATLQRGVDRILHARRGGASREHEEQRRHQLTRVVGQLVRQHLDGTEKPRLREREREREGGSREERKRERTQRAEREREEGELTSVLPVPVFPVTSTCCLAPISLSSNHVYRIVSVVGTCKSAIQRAESGFYE